MLLKFQFKNNEVFVYVDKSFFSIALWYPGTVNDF